MTLFTPFQDGEPGNAETFNKRFAELDTYISTLQGVSYYALLQPKATLNNITTVDILVPNCALALIYIESILTSAVGSPNMNITVNDDTTTLYESSSQSTSGSQTGSFFIRDATALSNALFGQPSVLEITVPTPKQLTRKIFFTRGIHVINTNIVSNTSVAIYPVNAALHKLTCTNADSLQFAEFSYTIWGIP